MWKPYREPFLCLSRFIFLSISIVYACICGFKYAWKCIHDVCVHKSEQICFYALILRTINTHYKHALITRTTNLFIRLRKLITAHIYAYQHISGIHTYIYTYIQITFTEAPIYAYQHISGIHTYIYTYIQITFTAAPIYAYQHISGIHTYIYIHRYIHAYMPIYIHT